MKEMMKKIGFVISLLVLFCAACWLLDYMDNKRAEEAVEQYKETQEVDELVIDTPEPTTEGEVVVLTPDENGEYHEGDPNYTFYDYQGPDIQVINDGKNGEKIRVVVYLPANKEE